MKTNSKIPKYFYDLIKKNPKIVSGRKNFDKHHAKLTKTLELIRRYFKID